MLKVFSFLEIFYWFIHLWLVVMCFWNLFLEKDIWRQISCVVVTVPFVLRMLYLR